MPNPRAQRPLSLQAVTEDIRSLAQPAQAMLDMLAGAAKGSISATAGLGGDIREIVNLLGEDRVKQLLGERSLPTTEEVSAFLPAVLPPTAPLSRQHSAGYGQTMGEFLPTPGSGEVVKGLVRGALSLPKAVQHGALEFAKASAAGAPHVVKPKGGNWITTGIEKAVAPLKSRGAGEADRAWFEQRAAQNPEEYRRAMEVIPQTEALNNWIESNLTNYIKKEMATPEDPIRLLLDRRRQEIESKFAKDQERARRVAERADSEADPRVRANLIRQSQQMMQDANLDREVATSSMYPINQPELLTYSADSETIARRREAGFPEEGMAKSPEAAAWENMADETIFGTKAKDYVEAQKVFENWKSLNDQFVEKLNEARNQVVKKYMDAGLSSEKARAAVHKMSHEDLAMVTGDDEFLKIGEQARDFAETLNLGRRGAFDENPWIAKVDPEIPIYKAIPTQLEGAEFNHIIDVLREDLASGRIRPDQLSKVSMEQAVRRVQEYDQEMAKKMREAQIKLTEGFPVHKEYPEGYKWIELRANKDLPSTDDGFGNMSSPGYGELEKALKYEGDTMGHCVGGYCDDVYEGRSRIYSLRDAKGEPHVTVEVQPQRRSAGDVNAPIDAVEYQKWISEELPPRIVQIKGKQNRAPKDEYLPFVQDFVRGGQWTDVGDLHNTGLYSAKDVHNYMPQNFTMSKNARTLAIGRARMAGDMPDYMTRDEYEAMLLKHAPEDIWAAEKKKNAEEADRLLNELQPPPEGMKRGGKVSISDNPDTMMIDVEEQKYGAGGVTKLARLSRAPAKSKEEIRAVAERIAPQLTGEFVRGEKGTQSVAGKTQKQFAREKELKHDIRGEMPAPGTIDYEKLKDQVVIGIPGDPTITGKSVHAVGETPLESPSPQHGGPLYGLGRDDDHFWASQLGAARRVQNLAREAGQQYDQPVLGQYIMMGPESINYAQHFADANLSAIDPTKMTKKQIEGFNKLLREGSPASGPRPSFPGIENKEDAYLYMAVDPELRKHFNALMQMPTVTQHFGLPSGIDVRHAVTEPALRDLETGVTGYSVGQMRPEIEDLKLSSHPTYSHDIPGHFLGQSRQPIPYEIMFPDTLQAIRGNPKQAPHEFGSLKMVGPRQTIDQQLIDEIKMYEEMVKKLTGKAAGGAISKAALTAMERLKELKAEAALKSDVWKAKQAADEAKYTQDIQPLTPEMMRAEIERMQNPVKKAAGGEITADDLILEERPL